MNLKVNRTDVEGLISKKRKDVFYNHLVNILLRDSQAQGMAKSQTVTVWAYSVWAGPLYPVFTFTFNTKHQCTGIKSSLNSGAKVLLALMAAWITYLVAFKIPFGFYVDERPWVALIILAFFSGLFLLIRYIYIVEKHHQYEDLLIALNVKENDERKTKEWGFAQIIFRLFTYPFSFFIIGFSLFYTINEGFEFETSAGLIIALIYLIADFSIILKRRRNRL